MIFMHEAMLADMRVSTPLPWDKLKDSPSERSIAYNLL